MTHEQSARIRALTDRHLTPAEAQAYLSAPLTDDEREETLQLVDWFTRRYPTPLERLQYVTRASRRWRLRTPL